MGVDRDGAEVREKLKDFDSGFIRLEAKASLWQHDSQLQVDVLVVGQLLQVGVQVLEKSMFWNEGGQSRQVVANAQLVRDPLRVVGLVVVVVIGQRIDYPQSFEVGLGEVNFQGLSNVDETAFDQLQDGGKQALKQVQVVGALADLSNVVQNGGVHLRRGRLVEVALEDLNQLAACLFWCDSVEDPWKDCKTLPLHILLLVSYHFDEPIEHSALKQVLGVQVLED